MNPSACLRPAVFAALSGFVPGLAASPAYDFAPVTEIFERVNTDLDLRGSTVRIAIHGQPVFERTAGTHDADTIVPIASASKTLSATVIMALVDDGLLTLDDKVADYVPSFNKPGGYADITIRQCFSHTSGLPGLEEGQALTDSSITLEQAANLIAEYALIGPPGGQFAYGGLSMQVAGRCAEVAAAKSWDDIFLEKIAIPLGMSDVDYTTIALLPPYRTNTNPRIAGGARCSARDYSRLMEMLRNNGVYNGRQVLSEASVREMLRSHTDGLPIIDSPLPPLQSNYGLGIWIDAIDVAGNSIQTIGAGAFGFAGWLDHEREIAGVFETVDQFQNISPYLREMQAALRTIVDTTPPSAADQETRVVNLSARARADRGDATLIAGFVVSGAPLDLVLRGVGPGLSGLGVDGATSDPFITLFDGSDPIGSNDDWSGNDGRALGAFPLAAGSRDAVIATTLAPRAYTAQVVPVATVAPGEALAEIYDAGGAGRLSNLSARSSLTGEQKLIVGFVISGPAGSRRSVLLRAVGPSLSIFGLAATLPDPRLELFNNNGSLIGFNDAWGGRSVIGETFATVGAFPFASPDSTDAALVVSLPPGVYTAHASNVGPGDGVTLAEIYALP